MNAVWQQLTLSNLPLYRWRNASYLYRLVGLLPAWRQGSWLMRWAEPLGALLVSLVFALAPFVSNDLVGVLLVACGAFWVLLTVSDEVVREREKEEGEAVFSFPKFTPIHLLVLLYWGIAVVATALSPVKAAALTGLVKLTLYLLLFALMARILRSPHLRSWLIALYLHVALLVSVYGLRQWFFGATALATWVDPESPLAKTTRVYSYLGNPNLLAGYLLPATALSLAAVFAWRGWVCKALATTMFVVNSSCLILTFSRGGWIGFVVLLFVFLLLLIDWLSIQLPPFWRTWSLPILLISLAAILGLAILFVEPLRDRVFSMFVGREDSSNNFRINVWAAVQEMIRARPIIGIGPGNTAFNKIYPLYMRPRYSALSAYSILLEVAVEAGLIGLGCFLWLLLVTFNQGWVQLRRLREFGSREGFWLIAAIASFLGMLAHGTVDTVLYRPEANTLWWMMIALIASYYTIYQPSRSENLPPQDL
ncbi:putative bicarbonate transporter, IctB family [Planktothrix sp. FACHB-1355]|uniref:Bicarbonate transporter, IctB family n=1 Tax=Aerosakkonema funiforme FACHB-1375 TaxID=2949571 RepID=A0A926VGS5_9CYAN|nr:MULTISPECIES: IctB family putative bicarbonate transporter [Oscillatoriales]MBD2183625.1 putative bicarbonate transporter, IctB family [Aerosakkonema funiforme FACHB-1375]MBD3558097.1 putative bicarbonate transporter, IctB family [Planktothrix sp. FACHB-1355]